MSPITHFLISWSVANSMKLSKRDRALVTLSGVAPDIDGMGMAVDIFTRGTRHPTDLWCEWHHVLGHNLGFAIGLVLAVLLLARRRTAAATLAFLCFNLHILCDLVGARGPDGDQWPIPLLSPFYQGVTLAWKGQWALNAWPNFVITGAFLALMFFIAYKKGVSPLEMVSERADRAFVRAVRNRLPGK